MMDSTFTIELVQQADYRFEVHFDNPAVPLLTTDEAPPLAASYAARTTGCASAASRSTSISAVRQPS